MGKKSAPPQPPAIDANQSMGRFLFGSQWGGGAGITDPQFQQRLVDAEAQWGPQYLQNSLALQEMGLFGTEGQEGLLDLYARSAPIVERMRADTASEQRRRDIEDVEKYGQQAVAAIRGADPEMQALIDRQSGLTGDLYDRAQGLTPQQRRMATQTAREGAMARGRGMDNLGMFAEVLGREEFLRGNRQEAQQSGQSLFGMLGATGGDPMMAVLGRPSQALPLNMQTAGAAMGLSGQASPQLFNPDTGLNMAMAQRAQDMEFQSDLYGSQQARSGAIWGGLASGLGALGGGMIARGSDRRLKRDITRVGTHPLGIGIYEFRYHGPSLLYAGVMAQELQAVMPEAVTTMPNGYLGVYYSMI